MRVRSGRDLGHSKLIWACASMTPSITQVSANMPLPPTRPLLPLPAPPPLPFHFIQPPFPCSPCAAAGPGGTLKGIVGGFQTINQKTTTKSMHPLRLTRLTRTQLRARAASWRCCGTTALQPTNQATCQRPPVRTAAGPGRRNDAAVAPLRSIPQIKPPVRSPAPLCAHSCRARAASWRARLGRARLCSSRSGTTRWCACPQVGAGAGWGTRAGFPVCLPFSEAGMGWGGRLGQGHNAA